jgi:hypothetical protein
MYLAKSIAGNRGSCELSEQTSVVLAGQRRGINQEYKRGTRIKTHAALSPARLTPAHE